MINIFLFSNKFQQKIYLNKLCASVLMIITTNICSGVVFTILNLYQLYPFKITEREIEGKNQFIDLILDGATNELIVFWGIPRRASAPI